MDLDFILRRTRAAPPEHRLNAAKEALQESLLAVLGLEGGLEHAAFQGGTALRILHRLPRYSEDLDFVWTGTTGSTGRLSEWPKIISRHLHRIGTVPHISETTKTVAARVPKRIFSIYLVAAEPKLSSLVRRDLQISLEVDLNPPAGYQVERKIQAIAEQPVALPALDLPSLMAGKLHILLTRLDREKGRDWYDYLWYRRRGIEPNLEQLQSAVDQTNEGVPARYWMSLIRARLAKTNWPTIRKDVAVFLERPEEVEWLSERVIGGLTPYPDFSKLLAAIRENGKTLPDWGTAAAAVKSDIAEAALGGDLTAFELNEAIDKLPGPDLLP